MYVPTEDGNVNVTAAAISAALPLVRICVLPRSIELSKATRTTQSMENAPLARTPAASSRAASKSPRRLGGYHTGFSTDNKAGCFFRCCGEHRPQQKSEAPGGIGPGASQRNVKLAGLQRSDHDNTDPWNLQRLYPPRNMNCHVTASVVTYGIDDVAKRLPPRSTPPAVLRLPASLRKRDKTNAPLCAFFGGLRGFFS